MAEPLERSRELSALGDALGQAASGEGRLVLVSGEAGVGKTLLLRRFCDERPRSVLVLWGACDPLFTPRPLGPFLEIAEQAGGELEQAVGREASPHELVSALAQALRKPVSVLVLEDLHWADEATLDVLRLLARRIEAAPTLVLASYRDDELDPAHPLRIVVGELATRASVERIEVAPLSRAAVAALAAPEAIDAEELYGRTNGNPFFVTEVLASGGERIPATVRDAVLARAGRLSPPARTLLDAVAVCAQRAEPWLLDALASDALNGLDECLGSGMLSAEARGVAFRHELARLAVAETIPPNRRLALHAAALSALADPPSGAPDVVRLTDHAEAAGDREAVLRLAPAAAQRASSVGAHREAAAQYARALQFGEALPQQRRAELLEGRAYECYLCDELDAAVEAQELALVLRREGGDPRTVGDALQFLGRLYGFGGLTGEGADACREAIAVLERLEPGRELARAYATLAQRHANWEETEPAVEWGGRALELADRLDDVEIRVHALTTLGAAEFRDRQGATDKLERALGMARRAGLEDAVGRAFTNLVWLPTRRRLFGAAERHLEAGLEYCDERGLDYWGLALVGSRARLELDRGRWTDAAESAALVLANPRSAPVPRVLAWVVEGLVRARRGDSGSGPALEAALALAVPTGEPQQIVPVAAARAEAAWLAGRPTEVIAATEPALAYVLQLGTSIEAGELVYWRWRAGAKDDLPLDEASPFGLQIAGDWRAAADAWERMGCPYESAFALADADELEALHQSLERLQALGAAPGARDRRASAPRTGCARTPARAARRDPRESGWADPARARGPRARR